MWYTVSGFLRSALELLGQTLVVSNLPLEAAEGSVDRLRLCGYSVDFVRPFIDVVLVDRYLFLNVAEVVDDYLRLCTNL